MQARATASHAGRWLPVLLIAVVVCYYFSFLYQYALNVPFADDIYDVLQVLTGVVNAPDAGTRFDILYAQHNDHRTLASRLVYALTFLVTGEINFRTLTFLANLALPLLLVLLYLATPMNKPRSFIILPAALILFQLRAYGITLWSMAAFAYFYVFLYGFASLHFLHEVNPRRFAVACVFATLATFTLASGQTVWLVGLASLLHQVLLRRSVSWRYVLGWIVVAAGILTAWRAGLETPNTLWAMLQQFFITPGHHVLYTLTLLGSAVSENSVPLSAATGALMLVTVLICSVRSCTRQDPRLELYCWFIILSVAAMVLGRAHFTTVDYALSSRYSFPSVLLLAAFWVTMAARVQFRSRGPLLAACGLAAIYSVSSYALYSEALQPQMEKRVTNFNKGKYWSWPRPMKETNAIVLESVSIGIYNPPAKPLPKPDIQTPAQ